MTTKEVCKSFCININLVFKEKDRYSPSKKKKVLRSRASYFEWARGFHRFLHKIAMCE